jgi:hypothetical protein
MMPDGIERVPEQVLEFEVIETRLSCTARAPGPCGGENILDDRPELQFEPTAV